MTQLSTRVGIEALDLVHDGLHSIVTGAELLPVPGLSALLFEVLPQLCPLRLSAPLTLATRSNVLINTLQRRRHSCNHRRLFSSDLSFRYAECRELHITDKVGDTKHRVILSVHTGKVPSYRCNPFQYPTKVVAVEVFQRRHHPRGARVVAIENDVPILTVDPSTQHVVAVRQERIHSLLYQTSLSVDIRL